MRRIVMRPAPAMGVQKGQSASQFSRRVLGPANEVRASFAVDQPVARRTKRKVITASTALLVQLKLCSPRTSRVEFWNCDPCLRLRMTEPR